MSKNRQVVLESRVVLGAWDVGAPGCAMYKPRYETWLGAALIFTVQTYPKRNKSSP